MHAGSQMRNDFEISFDQAGFGMFFLGRSGVFFFGIFSPPHRFSSNGR